MLSPGLGDDALVTARSSSRVMSAAAGGDLDHFFDRIDGMKPHANVIAEIGRDAQTHDVGLDRDLAMAAIDQHRQADARRPPQVADRIEGGADGPAREQDVVHQHHLGPVDVERDLGAPQHGPALDVLEIVAIERDVDRPDFDILARAALAALEPAAGRGERRCSDAHQVQGRTPRRPASASLRAIEAISPLISWSSHSRCSPGFIGFPPSPSHLLGKPPQPRQGM